MELVDLSEALLGRPDGEQALLAERLAHDLAERWVGGKVSDLEHAQPC